MMEEHISVEETTLSQLAAMQPGGKRVVLNRSSHPEGRRVIRICLRTGSWIDASSLTVDQAREHLAAGACALVLELPDRDVSIDEKRELLYPQEMDLTSIQEGCVTAVFAACEGSFLVAGEAAYGCGLNGDGQVGVGYLSLGVPVPQRICQMAPEGWLGGSLQASFALSHGTVTAWGKAEECGLGLGPGSDPVLLPRAVGLPPMRTLRCGTHHAIACSEAGDVFFWGCGLSHQLGNRPRDSNNPDDKNEDPPDEIRPYMLSSKQLEQRYVLMADGGAQHTVELAWDGTYAELRELGVDMVMPDASPMLLGKRPAAKVMKKPADVKKTEAKAKSAKKPSVVQSTKGGAAKEQRSAIKRPAAAPNRSKK